MCVWWNDMCERCVMRLMMILIVCVCVEGCVCGVDVNMLW